MDEINTSAGLQQDPQQMQPSPTLNDHLQKHNISEKTIILFATFLVIAVVGGYIGYVLHQQNEIASSTPVATQNITGTKSIATTSNTTTQTSVTATPTATPMPTLNKTATDNTTLNSDLNTLNKNLTSIDQGTADATQGFNDQSTNLQ